VRVLLFIIPIFLFIGCNKTSQISLRSNPEGANVYDKKSKKFIAKTPAELSYVFDSDPESPECEKIPPIVAVWGNNDAMITEDDLVVCPNKDYKIVINQYTFKKPAQYKLVEYEEEWRFVPYLGVNLISSSIDMDVTKSNTSVSNNSNEYLYKVGFVDKSNNRLEINYSTLELDDKDLNLYSLDTIIPIEQLKDINTEPYFKFGLGFANYTYNSTAYSNSTYTLGFGFLGYLNEDLELDVGFSNRSHINYGSLAKEMGFNSISGSETKINLKNILMGLNYKF
jgi:hypothetical protein